MVKQPTLLSHYLNERDSLILPDSIELSEDNSQEHLNVLLCIYRNKYIENFTNNGVSKNKIIIILSAFQIVKEQ